MKRSDGKARCPQCEELARELEKLREEIARLRSQLEKEQRAGKRQAAPFSKGEPKKNPKRPGRKGGKEYGEHRRRAVPTNIHEIVDVPLGHTCCPDCGGTLGDENVDQQYVTDLPPVKPHTTQFNIHSALCKDCGRRVQGRHPKQHSDALGAAASQIGPNALALGAQLNKVLGASYERISDFFDSVFSLSVSRSTLARATMRLGEKAKPLYDQIVLCVRQSDVIYPDETGWRVGGNKAWLWDFVSILDYATAYAISPGRGFDVAERILGADYNGTLGRDGWKVYDGFELADHQICLAHVLRRCNTVLEVVSQGAVRFPRALKDLIADSFDLRERRDAGLVSDHGVLVATGRLQNRLEELLSQNFTNEDNRKLANYAYRYVDDFFTFLKNPAVEATNWPAEQGIRPAVVNRKMSGGNRSWKGAQAQATLMSVFRTAWQRGLNAVELLVDLFRSSDPKGFARSALGP